MINAKQIRAARALLNWTQDFLAERSGIARATIKNVEGGTTLPRLETANALQRSFEEAGVEFLPGSGVRMQDRMVQVFEGPQFVHALMEDIFTTLRDTAGSVYIANADEQAIAQDVGEIYLADHLRRRRDADIKHHILVRASDNYLTLPLKNYRILADDYFSPHPFIIYGSKLALQCREAPQKTIVIHDERFAEAAKGLFRFIWDHTEMPTHKQLKKTDT